MGQRLKITVTEQEIFLNTQHHKNPRSYICERFKREHGMDVIKFGHTYDAVGNIVDKGLEYKKADTDLYLVIEVWGEVGKSIQPCEPERD